MDSRSVEPAPSMGNGHVRPAEHLDTKNIDTRRTVEATHLYPWMLVIPRMTTADLILLTYGLKFIILNFKTESVEHEMNDHRVQNDLVYMREVTGAVCITGEASWRQERALYDPAAAGLSAASVQAGLAAGAAAGGAHPVPAGHHAGPLAVRQTQPAAGGWRYGGTALGGRRFMILVLLLKTVLFCLLKLNETDLYYVIN